MKKVIPDWAEGFWNPDSSQVVKLSDPDSDGTHGVLCHAIQTLVFVGTQEECEKAIILGKKGLL